MSPYREQAIVLDDPVPPKPKPKWRIVSNYYLDGETYRLRYVLQRRILFFFWITTDSFSNNKSWAIQRALEITRKRKIPTKPPSEVWWNDVDGEITRQPIVDKQRMTRSKGPL